MPDVRSLRDVVRFSLPHGVDARGVAGELVAALGGILVEAVTGDRDHARFGYLWLPRQTPEVITIERFAPAGSVATAYRDADPRSVWLFRSSKYREVSEFCARLGAMGAGDLRWFTEEEWSRGAPGHSF